MDVMSYAKNYIDTSIAAIATPLGSGGVGIVRVSGAMCLEIAEKILGKKPVPRNAYFCELNTEEQVTIDEGLLIYFKAPHSFTGEDVLEFQGHGGIIVLQRVLKRMFELGAVPARAGEFSERAFFNGKLDLVQAEAIHDLINSHSEAQASAAMKSLSGAFSTQINTFLETLILLRVYVEACIDFSDEDIDFIEQGDVRLKIVEMIAAINQLLESAHQGKILRDGLQVVLAGRPNAGKSSLLNALCGTDSAIVTDIAGTTRDVLKERIEIDGLPLHIIDTAGIRDTDNVIEIEGIKRTRQAMHSADLVLWLHDDQDHAPDSDLQTLDIDHIDQIIVLNKIDVTGKIAGVHPGAVKTVAISAKNHTGLDDLKAMIKNVVGFKPQESVFSARARHLDALKNVLVHLNTSLQMLDVHQAIEIIAEELRLAQNSLGEITGQFTPDDLLGEIFGNFCIGK